MPAKPVFISHATVDKELADKFVQLMESGIGVPDRDVFCTSLEGLGIPAGENFVSFIRSQIQSPTCVVLLLTPHYYASEFCLCELGASWALSNRVFPFILPPLAFADLKGVLTGTQALRINTRDGLNQFQEELIGTLGIKGKAFAIWEKRRDEFLAWVEAFIKDYKVPEKIDPARHKKLQKDYDEAKEELGKSQEAIDALNETIGKISALKDQDEVDEILEENIDDIEKFDALISEAQKACDPLPHIAISALYKHFRGESLDWPAPGYSDTEEKVSAIRDALESGYLVEISDEVGVNEEDPLVGRAISAMRKVYEFVNHPSEEFADYYRKNHDHQLDLTNKRFWNTYF